MAASATLATAASRQSVPPATMLAMAAAGVAPAPSRSPPAPHRTAPGSASAPTPTPAPAPATTSAASAAAGGVAGSTAQATAPTHGGPERRRRGLTRSFALPLAAVGLAVLLPWRALDVLSQWQSLSSTAQAAQTQPAVPPSPPVATTLASNQPPAPVATQMLPSAPPLGAFDAQHAADSRLLSEIAQRAAALDQRDRELQTRAAQVAAAERLARQQIAELTQLRQQMEKQVAHESDASEGDINLLVGLYSNMKPPQAAAVLGRLDAAQAAEILQRLDIHSAGPVLAAMDPAAALAVTQVLATRRVAFRR